MAIIADGLGVTGASVDKVLRLGGVNQNRMVKPRVLLVQQTNGRKRERDILYSAKNLRGTEKWAETNVAPELTCGQRNERKKHGMKSKEGRAMEKKT